MTSKNTAHNASDASKDRSILTDLQGSGQASSDVAPDLTGVNPGTPKSKLKVHSQTLVIALVLAASGAALYMMRKQGMGAGVNFNPPKIDYDLDNTKRIASQAQQQKILEDLARSQELPNLATDKIPKNPFQLDSAPPVVGAADDGSRAAMADVLRKQQELQERQNRITTALGTIEVGAIMEGPTPLARINGKIVREGDTVAEVFTVKEIHDRSVDLMADGKIYNVNMAEGAGVRPHTAPPRK